MKSLIALLLFTLLSGESMAMSTPPDVDDCPSSANNSNIKEVRTFQELKDCFKFQNLQNNTTINIMNDLSCSSDESCCTAINSGFTAPMWLRGSNTSTLYNNVIDGNGHTITRGAGYTKCNILRISDNVVTTTIKNLTLDDNKNILHKCVVKSGHNHDAEIDSIDNAYDIDLTGGPDLNGDGADDRFVDNNGIIKNCLPTVWVRGTTESVVTTLKFENFNIHNAKQYAMLALGATNFTYHTGVVKDSQILGVQLGESNTNGTIKPTTGAVLIEGVTFMDNSTNGLAFSGVEGTTSHPARIVGNKFYRNHFFGQWPVSPAYGGIEYTGGGQLLLQKANHVNIAYNDIADGYCTNCYEHNYPAYSGVSGIEIGKASVINSVSYLNFHHNNVEYNDGPAFAVNNNVIFDSTNSIRDNKLHVNLTPYLNSGTALIQNNQITPIKNLEDFENHNNGNTNNWQFWQVGDPTGNGLLWKTVNSEVLHGNYAIRFINKEHTSNNLSWHGQYAIGMETPITAGNEIRAATWVRKANSAKLQMCIKFFDNNNSEINSACQNAGNLEGWRYKNTAKIVATAPPGSAFFKVRLGSTEPNSYVDVDYLKIGY